MARIICGKCGLLHESANQVKACYAGYQPQQPVINWREQPMTDKQRATIERLGGLVTPDLNRGTASDKIETLIKIDKQRKAAGLPALANARVPSAPASWSPNHHEPKRVEQPKRPAPETCLKTPLAMIENLRDGRYAVRADENEKYMFIKVWRPKSGRKKGCLIISTQHSESYKECIVRWPSGRWSVYDSRPDRNLIFVVADPITAARAYGREKNRCCRCGKELTDGRSIWYSIGPECEKSFPEIIDAVDEEFGRPYQTGDSRSNFIG